MVITSTSIILGTLVINIARSNKSKPRVPYWLKVVSLEMCSAPQYFLYSIWSTTRHSLHVVCCAAVQQLNFFVCVLLIYAQLYLKEILPLHRTQFFMSPTYSRLTIFHSSNIGYRSDIKYTLKPFRL